MLGHSSIVTTADTYTKPRVLHQAGEKPQVSWSVRALNRFMRQSEYAWLTCADLPMLSLDA